MPERNYRTVLYENYVSIQAPEWVEDNARASAVRCAGGLCRLRNWLPSAKNAKCLDLGCGSGRLLRALRGTGYSDVHGVDFGPQATDLARKAGFQVTQADLRKYLMESREHFDLITAFDVIEHFGKDEAIDVLQLIWKRLKPGGIFILQTPNALSPWSNSLKYGDLTHEVIYTPKCLASLLRMTGFTRIETRNVQPCIHSLKGFILWPLRTAVWFGYAGWSLAETGSLLGGVYSRNMLMRAMKDSV